MLARRERIFPGEVEAVAPGQENRALTLSGVVGKIQPRADEKLQFFESQFDG
jgi:hypothetical protein